MKRYKAQYFDTDTASWEDMDHEGSEGTDRREVEREAKYQAGQCAHRIRVRVVEV